MTCQVTDSTRQFLAAVFSITQSNPKQNREDHNETLATRGQGTLDSGFSFQFDISVMGSSSQAIS